MSTNDIAFAVFVALISLAAILRLYRIRGAKLNSAMEVRLYGSQTMCPACGAITDRSATHCLHCGKPMPRA